METLCFLLFFFFFLSPATVIVMADENSVMSTFLRNLKPSPSRWSNTTDHCSWSGVKCDKNNHVISIDLQSKSLSGTLPTKLNKLTQITSITLQNNSLSGPLPSFANLALLTTLALDSNNFSSVPTGAFSGLTSLRTLTLSMNPNLSPWQFPLDLTKSTALTDLNLNDTNLVGRIPDIFDSFPNLTALRLSHNGLNESLPGSLNGSLIQYLWANDQREGLTGPIDVISGMTKLKQVWLHDNKLTGPIPDLSACPEIFDLQLKDNVFTGIVPASVVSLPNLLNVSLQNNMLQGPKPQFPPTVDMINLGRVGTNTYCMPVSGDCDEQVTILLQVAAELGYPIQFSEDWVGNDACNGWNGITCDNNRKIIKVDLAKRGFTGTISPAFANLTSLRELYLNGNNLSGVIPSSLATLPHLKVLDVSDNNLTGRSPGFPPGVDLITTGNPVFDKDHGKRAFSKVVKIGLGVLMPVLAIVVLVFGVHEYKKRSHHAEHLRNVIEQLGSFLQLATGSPIRFTYRSLKAATNNFDMARKLGGGGFGTVFEGALDDGTTIAVKRLDHSGQGMKEFLTEVQTIGSVHHVNLVKLVGFCAERSYRLLVYEYMSNGSLDNWIFNPNSMYTLSWETKKKIIVHIAKGLAYLHEGCQKRIAHLDIKPQNVLLDKDFNAKLSDFGLAKLIDTDKSYVVTQMRGTRGYLAPEWLGRQITEKVDVYSYGIVVLEIVFGRKTLDLSQPEESDIFLQRVKKKAGASEWSDLLGNCNEYVKQNCDEMRDMVKLAVWCLHSEPAKRPSMSMVVKVLEGATIPEASNDYSLIVFSPNEKPNENLLGSATTSLIAVSILSGPR